MVALALWSPFDPLLGVIAPLALAASVSSALVVDLVPDEPSLPSDATLADLVTRGPTRSELVPDRHGIAVLANGDVSFDAAADVIAALIEGWPHVVFRSPVALPAAPLAQVLPLLPPAIVGHEPNAIYQRVAWSGPAPATSITIPRPAAGSIRALLDARRPIRGPWLRAWRKVWRRSWQ